MLKPGDQVKYTNQMLENSPEAFVVELCRLIGQVLPDTSDDPERVWIEWSGYIGGGTMRNHEYKYELEKI